MRIRPLAAHLALIGALASAVAAPARAGFPHPEAPRTVNVFLHTDVPGKEALLSQWDMVILPFMLLDWAPSSLSLIRQYNPDIIILVYIDPLVITDSLGPDDLPGTLRYDRVTTIDPAWLARTETGEVISFWEHSQHVNITPVCPVVGGERYRDHFLHFVRDRLFPYVADGTIDGLFLDEMSAGGFLWWDPLFAGSFDYNNNGLADRSEAGIGDETLLAWLTESQQMVADSLNAWMPPGCVLMGNNANPRYDALEGKLFESYPNSSSEGYFEGTLMNLDVWNSLEFGTNIVAINAVYPYAEVGGSPDDMPPFRFRFTSTLLGDNYFSYDFTTFDHYQLTYYELFDHNLGLPLAPRHSIGETPLFVDTFEGGVGPHVTPFTPHASVTVTSEPGLVLEGDSSLLITSNAADPFPTLFYVNPPGGWLPDTPYVLSFRYRILDTAQPESRLFFKSSPGAAATTVSPRIEGGAEGLYRGTIQLTSTNDAVRLLTRGEMTMVIDSLCVVQGTGGLLAREYEHGLVVCNPSGSGKTFAYDPHWTLLPGDGQATDFAAWDSAHSIVIGNEDGVVFARSGTAVDPPPALPAGRVTLSEPWPNPGNPSFSVTVGGTGDQTVALLLHDVQGRRLARLWSGRPSAGGETLRFTAGENGVPDLASGVYILRAAAASGDEQLRRLVILH
ncbi:MAG: hypothetical protein H6694_00815 [Candidatus Latescibacteria bacterium]|nr:hypothetical protein [Candidatus Latescibacterota bacterium]